MPRIDISNLDKELRRGEIRPIYIIVGAEHHLALGALRAIQDAVGGKGSSLAARTFSGKEANAERVLGALKTVSMFGERPLIIIRDAEAVGKDTLEALADYAQSPVASSTLVVVAEKLDGRSRFMQVAAKSGAVIECKPLYLDKVPQWINIEVKRQGRQISLDAARFLAEMIGSDLGSLTQAIERIILYVGDKRAIETQDVEMAVAETHQRTVFELTDAVGTRRLPRALSLLHNILGNGESPILVLNMLARHYRILSKAKEVAGRMDGGNAASYLGVHPYYAKDYLSQSRSFSSSELRNGFRILSRCDRELKSSRIPKERVIERALFALIGKNPSQRQ